MPANTSPPAQDSLTEQFRQQLGNVQLAILAVQARQGRAKPFDRVKDGEALAIAQRETSKAIQLLQLLELQTA